jgi:hypothetical protein
MRRARMMYSGVACAALLALVGAGCSEDAFVSTDGGGYRDGGGGWPDAMPLGDLVSPADAPGGVCGDGKGAIVWAHSADDLYRFDPISRTVNKVGAFHGEGVTSGFGMTDIAVDGEGTLYGIGRGYIYRIDAQTAAVTRVFGDGSVQGNALTFLPKGEYANEEVLVVGYTRFTGAQESVLAQIDLKTQTQKDIQTIAGGCATSGDVVSVTKLGTYVTLVCSDDKNGDVLAKLDVKTGQATRVGNTGFRAIYGLGFWCDRFYGFIDSGQLIEIDPKTGAGTLVNDQTGASSFWGAGVKTTAPVAPIK